MGNITFLNRYQNGTGIDGLSYTYTSGGNPTNQLQSITDNTGNDAGLVHGTTTYAWDGNGNMLSNTNTVTTTQNKSFAYNLLNLPQTVTVPGGTLTYTYDALGNKLRKVSVISGTTKTTDYINGIEYDGGTTDTLNFIQTEEGKAAKFGAIYDYNYYLGDNLGNTRVSFGTKTGSAVLYQQDDYYPFGMEISQTPHTPKNEYLYNKKELQEETQEYDYGARYYDPIIARWNTIDPLAETSRRWSPYNYVENDPIRLTDPDGMEALISGEDVSNITDPQQIAGIINKEKRRQKKDDKASDKEPIKAKRSSTTMVKAKIGPIRPKPREISEEQQKTYDKIDKLPPVPGQKNTLMQGKQSDAINEIFFENYIIQAGAFVITGSVSLEAEEVVTVGRWMSSTEYEAMSQGGRVLEGAGGQTFVTTGGPGSYMAASEGSVYVEFQVPANSLLQGGKANWFKMVGPNASQAMKVALEKQGGQLLPQFQNLSRIITIK